MARYKLSDVVMRIKDKVDKDNTDLEFYIGGEHFDNGEICITKRGVIKESTIGPAFHMRFKPGDVLLMSRNPHLRKAGVVDFEGICSDVSYVCRTKDENVLMQRFLPFIFQTDDFWKFAEENKGGSTNFFLNWSDFERYEFELPSIEKQRPLTEILWAAQNTKLAYLELLRQTDELVKSQFIELFGYVKTNDKSWKTKPLKELCNITRGGSPRPIANYLGGTIPWIKIGDATDGDDIYINSTKEYIIEEGMRKSRYVKAGSLIFANCGVSLGFCRIINIDGCIHDGWLALQDIDKSLNKEFLLMTINQLTDYFRSIAPGATQPNLNTEIMGNYQQILPPLELQEKYIAFVKQTDKSKYYEQNRIFYVTRGGELCA